MNRYRRRHIMFGDKKQYAHQNTYKKVVAPIKTLSSVEAPLEIFRQVIGATSQKKSKSKRKHSFCFCSFILFFGFVIFLCENPIGCLKNVQRMCTHFIEKMYTPAQNLGDFCSMQCVIVQRVLHKDAVLYVFQNTNVHLALFGV